jgi:predicted PurR-regulated permease PerM
MSQRQHYDITISTETIIKILVVLFGVLFIGLIKDVLLIVFIALVLAAAIDPAVTAMERRGIPRGFGVAILYVLLFGFTTLVVGLFIPVVVSQLEQLAKSLPTLYDQASKYFHSFQDTTLLNGLEKGLQSVSSSLANATSGIFSQVFTFFGGVFSFFGVLVITFYLTMEEKGMKRLAIDIAPEKYRAYVTQLFARIEERLGKWLRGQLLLGLIIFLLTWVGLLVLGVKYALVLALIAGITELIPAVGPFIGAVPAVLVALSQNPTLAIWVMGLYIIVQQLENHLIVPKVMSSSTGLNPVLVIISLLIGAKVAGVVGVVLAIPTALMIMTFFEDFVQERNGEDRLEAQP